MHSCQQKDDQARNVNSNCLEYKSLRPGTFCEKHR